MKTPVEIFDGNGRIEILDADGLPIAHVYHRGRSGGKSYLIDGKTNATQIVDALNAAHRADSESERALAKALLMAQTRIMELQRFLGWEEADIVPQNLRDAIATALAAHAAAKR